MFSTTLMELKINGIRSLLYSRYQLSIIQISSIGYVIQFLSFGAFISVVTGNPAKFAIIYSFGNVLALSAYTLFYL
jgi:hypothetical protein